MAVDYIKQNPAAVNRSKTQTHCLKGPVQRSQPQPQSSPRNLTNLVHQILQTCPQVHFQVSQSHQPFHQPHQLHQHLPHLPRTHVCRNVHQLPKMWVSLPLILARHHAMHRVRSPHSHVQLHGPEESDARCRRGLQERTDAEM
jgi:hypothetical protein